MYKQGHICSLRRSFMFVYKRNARLYEQSQRLSFEERCGELDPLACSDREDLSPCKALRPVWDGDGSQLRPIPIPHKKHCEAQRCR